MLMIRPATLDPDLLRAFVFIAEERSFTRAAQLVGLYAVGGVDAGPAAGGGARPAVAPPRAWRQRGADPARPVPPAARTGHVGAERRDWRTFHTPSVSGAVCLGTPDDYALRFLPNVLKRFAEVHPDVEVEVVCAPSSELVPKLKSGMLDLALLSDGHQPDGQAAQELWRGPLVWIGSDRHSTHRLDPLPLALASPTCCWRNAAISQLASAGRRYRVAYTAATQIGTLAPVMAGLAVTVSPATLMPLGLRALGPEDGMPPLPDFQVVMVTAREARQPVTAALADYIADTFGREAEKATRSSTELAA